MENDLNRLKADHCSLFEEIFNCQKKLQELEETIGFGDILLE